MKGDSVDALARAADKVSGYAVLTYSLARTTETDGRHVNQGEAVEVLHYGLLDVAADIRAIINDESQSD